MATKGAKQSARGMAQKTAAKKRNVRSRIAEHKHMTLAVSRNSEAVLTQPADWLRADLWTEMPLSEVWDVVKERLMPAPKHLDSVRKPRVKRASQVKESPLLWLAFSALVGAVTLSVFSVIYTIITLA